MVGLFTMDRGGRQTGGCVKLRRVSASVSYRATDAVFGNYPNDYPLGDASDGRGGAV